MNSILDYIRQLNIQSVSLRDEWLERLLYAECDPGEKSLAPEVVLTRKSGIGAGADEVPEPPVTIVRRDTPVSGPKSASTPVFGDIGRPAQPADRRDAFGEMEIGPLDTEELDLLLQDVLSQSAESLVTPGQLPGAPTAGFVSTEEPANVSKHRTETPRQPATIVGDDAGTEMHYVTIPGPEQILESLEDPAEQPPEPLIESPVGLRPECRDSKPDGDALWQAGEAVASSAAVAAPVHQRESISSRPSRNPTVDSGSSATAGSRSIDRMADQILDRFPGIAPVTLMFASAEPGTDVDGLAARVAAAMASRDASSVLLVDGNGASGRLTEMMGVNGSAGLAEVVNRDVKPRTLALATDSPRLAFLPVGKGPMTNRKLDAIRASALNRQFSENWQFTIISAGSCGDPLVQSWARHVDAVYLVVDLEKADRDRVIRLVDNLREQSVRVAGCIAMQP